MNIIHLLPCNVKEKNFFVVRMRLLCYRIRTTKRTFGLINIIEFLFIENKRQMESKQAHGEACAAQLFSWIDRVDENDPIYRKYSRLMAVADAEDIIFQVVDGRGLIANDAFDHVTD